MARTGFVFSRRQDIYDEPTGIYALWYFEQRLEEECSRARRNGGPLTVISLQVDARSAVAVGHKLRRDVRDYDFIGRVANGRFVVVMLDAGPAVADALGARLRKTVDAAPDIGFAWVPEDGDTASALLQRAQQRMLNAAKAA